MIMHYQNPPVCDAEFKPICTDNKGDVTCGNCRTIIFESAMEAKVSSRVAERRQARAEIVALKWAGFSDIAIEAYRDSHYDLLVEVGLCKYQPEPKDNPLARLRTANAFA